MRLTWLVLGVVVAAGAVAFINTDEETPTLPVAKVTPKTPRVAPQGDVKGEPPGFDLTRTEEDAKAEKRAQALLKQLAEAQAQGGGKLRTIAMALRKDKAAWDSEPARRHAYIEGQRLAVKAMKTQGKAAIGMKDEARRLLSRGIYLPEMFTKEGHPTQERQRAIDAIQKLNRQVMLYSPGIPDVTEPYVWPSGLVPVQVVSRKKLPMGPNALLYWNQGGNLDPRRMRAETHVLLPLEELTLRVSLRYRRLAIFMGDWFVKEYRVGIGAVESPSPTGTFWVHSKQKNPDWDAPNGKKIPWADKENNELGDAWIAIVSNEYPKAAGYGIHGTNKPKTVGTRCSRGCVRLRNDQAVELLGWVRRATAGGKATHIYMSY